MKNTIAILGSHSALDVCRGAKNLGFNTLVVTEKSRGKTYSKYFKTSGDLGCVDKVLELEKFSDLLKKENEKKLKDVIFIPHRSFEVYLDFNYKAIETWKVPIFGNRFLLKIEERGVMPNQYDLLDKAKIKYPKQFKNPKDIDRICLVKVLEKTRGFERAFFLVKDYQDYKEQIEKRLKSGEFTEVQLKHSVIEEFILGVQVNFNFFYSPIHKRLELLGTDTRRQTNLEGFNKLPANLQDQALEMVGLKFEEAGHIAVTVLESLLEQAFEMGERFVKAVKKLYSPGIIGPFALQSIITPGPPKKEIIVIDVSPRMPGSPGISSTPYTNYLYGRSFSVGERVAMEIKEAQNLNLLDKILT